MPKETKPGATPPLERIRERERRMTLASIADPSGWPLRTRLPMKRRREGGSPDTAFLQVALGLRLFLIDLDAPITPDSPFEEFASAEEMVDAGWVVD